VNSTTASRNAAFAHAQFWQVQLMFLHPIPLLRVAGLLKSPIFQSGGTSAF
jgi:hypothetical protein